MNVVCYERGLLWTWSVMNVVCYEWVCYERGLLWMGLLLTGLLWTWSVLNGLLWAGLFWTDTGLTILFILFANIPYCLYYCFLLPLYVAVIFMSLL